MTFAEICIQDGKVTKAGEIACEMLFEKVTGKCAHGNGQWDGIEGNSFVGGRTYQCKRCGAKYRTSLGGPSLPECPPLATSLDAHVEHIFPHLFFSKRLKIAESMGLPICPANFIVLMRPIRLLEAELRAYNLYDEWEARVK